MTTILAFILVLGLVILVHEAGHFVAAKATGVRVLAFSIGMGPRIVSFTRGETEYAICWLPIGGYVKMAGEEPEELDEGAPEPVWEPGDFMYASVPRRLAIITAGPVMNLVLAVFLYMALPMVYGLNVIPTTTIGAVVPGSLAEDVGIRSGDRIIQVDGRDVADWNEAITRIQDGIGQQHTVAVHRMTRVLTFSLPSLIEGDGTANEAAVDMYGLSPEMTTELASLEPGEPAEQAGMKAGDRIVQVAGQKVTAGSEVSRILAGAGEGPVWLTYERDGNTHTVSIVPRTTVDDSTGAVRRRIGVYFAAEVVTRHPGPVEAVRIGAQDAWDNMALTVDVVGRLVSGRISAKTLGGPVMIAQFAGNSARGGLRTLLFFVAFLSIQLGILNLLPIPVLDGGHLVFLGAEALRGRPLSMKVRLVATQVGMVFLLMLMLYVTFNDVLRLL